MLARIVDSVKLAPPTATLPLPVCRPSVTLLSDTQAAATSSGLLRSTSTAWFIATRSSVVSFFETAFSAGSTAALAEANCALTAGMTLSAFCRCLSSWRTTSWSPATGLQASPEAALFPLVVPLPEPDEPDWPQPATSTATAANEGRRSERERTAGPAFCVPWATSRSPRVSGGRSPASAIEPPPSAPGQWGVATVPDLLQRHPGRRRLRDP